MSLPTDNIILTILTPGRTNPFFDLKINGALIDTGSQKTLIRKSILDSHRIPLKVLSNYMHITNAMNMKSGNVVKNYITANVNLGRSKIKLQNREILVINGDLNYPMIIGIDILQSVGIDFRKPEIFSNNI